MSRRTRRASTSSLDPPLHWHSEASVLHSIPKNLPSDDWPIFDLRDAIVLNRDGTTIESALHIVTNGPYIVRGYLHFTADQRKRHVLARQRSPIPIEVRHCLLYSIGETDEGSPQIWVSGRAGWFEISPCSAYQITFVTMCQATTLYYSIMDSINAMPASSKRTKKSKSPYRLLLGPIFHKYASTIGDGSTFQDVAARCDSHAVFLFSQFHQDEGAMDWKMTYFYKWLKARNSETFAKVEQARLNPRQRTRSPSIIDPPPRATTTASRKSASIEEVEESMFKPNIRPTRSTRSSSAATATAAAAAAQPTTIPLHPRRSQSQQKQPTPIMPPPLPPPLPFPNLLATHSPSDFDTVLTAVQDCFESILLSSKKGVRVSALLNKLYFQYRFPTYKDSTPGSHKIPVQEVLHYNATQLLDAIDADKYKRGEIYDFLLDLASKEFAPVALKPYMFPFRILSRGQRPYLSRKSDKSNVALDVTHTKLSEPRTPSPVTPRVGKRPSRPVGSKSSLRPIQSTKKRWRINLGDEEDVEAHALFKKLHTEPQVDGDHDHIMADAQGSVEEQFGQEAQADDDESDSSMEEDEALDQEGRPVRLTILAEKLPGMLPTGHHGTWVCEQADCDFIARGGDEDELNDCIAAHLQGHERLVDRMQLAVAESRGLLPINHLLQKLKRVGDEHSQSLVDSNGQIAPQPIKRRLFV